VPNPRDRSLLTEHKLKPARLEGEAMASKEDTTTAAARTIIEAERRERADKTARLRKARLAQETAQPPPEKRGRAPAKAKKAKR